MEIGIGSVVISKAGRDKTDWFIVIGLDGDYAMLANGDSRKTDKPKKKKLKHLQKTNYISDFIKEKMKNSGTVENHEVRKALSQFKSVSC